MPNVSTPTETWFRNLEKLQICVKNLNHLTAAGLKAFSKQTLGSLITSDLMKGNLGVCCQNNGIGLVPDNAFSDMTKNFFWFLDKVSNISIKAAVRSQIFSVVVKYRPELITQPTSAVIAMSLNEAFGDQPLNSNTGKKELDLLLNQITPDEFYPTDGSLFADGSRPSSILVDAITR